MSLILLHLCHIQHLFPLREPIRGAEEDKLRSGTRLDVSTGLFWSGDESVLVAKLKGLVKNVNSGLLYGEGSLRTKGEGSARVKLLREERREVKGKVWKVGWGCCEQFSLNTINYHVLGRRIFCSLMVNHVVYGFPVSPLQISDAGCIDEVFGAAIIIGPLIDYSTEWKSICFDNQFIVTESFQVKM